MKLPVYYHKSIFNQWAWRFSEPKCWVMMSFERALRGWLWQINRTILWNCRNLYLMIRNAKLYSINNPFIRQYPHSFSFPYKESFVHGLAHITERQKDPGTGFVYSNFCWRQKSSLPDLFAFPFNCYTMWQYEHYIIITHKDYLFFNWNIINLHHTYQSISLLVPYIVKELNFLLEPWRKCLHLK